MEEKLKGVENRLENLEVEVSSLKNEMGSLRHEIRAGFHTMKDTLEAMFNITASGLRANREVAEIMETAYGEASAKYAEIKAKKKG